MTKDPALLRHGERPPDADGEVPVQGAGASSARASSDAAAAMVAAAQADREDEDDAESVTSFQLSQVRDADKLFHSDGSRKSSLRKTVEAALRGSKFDSVSALLSTAQGRKASESIGLPFGATALRKQRRKQKAAGKGKKKGRGKGKKKAAGAKAKRRGSIYDEEQLEAAGRRGRRASLQEIAEAGPPVIRELTMGASLARTDGEPDDPAASVAASARDGVNAAIVPDGETGKVLPVVDVPVDYPPKQRREVCFLCWSLGDGAHCQLHREGEHDQAPTVPGLQGDQSVLACSSWHISALARKYRAEELHTVFSRTAASLRYDRASQAFFTVDESRHPLFRAMTDAVAFYNERRVRVRRRLAFLRSLMEAVRTNTLQDSEGGVGKLARSRQEVASRAWLRLKGTIVKHRRATRLHWLSAHRLKLGPATGLLPVRHVNRVTEGNIRRNALRDSKAAAAAEEGEESAEEEQEVAWWFLPPEDPYLLIRRSLVAKARIRQRQREEEAAAKGEQLDPNDDIVAQIVRLAGGGDTEGLADDLSDPGSVAAGETGPADRLRRRRAARKQRGAGLGLLAEVETLRWDEGAEGPAAEAVLAAGADRHESAVALATSELGRGHAGSLDDPVLRQLDRQARRAMRFKRFATDSFAAYPIMTDVRIPSTITGQMQREGIIYAETQVDDRGRVLLLGTRASETDDAQLTGPPLLPVRAPRNWPVRDRASVEHEPGWLDEDYQADEDRAVLELQQDGLTISDDTPLGPSDRSLGHRDHPNMPWRYIVALPPPRPYQLLGPRPAQPYDPRTVPVPVPDKSAQGRQQDQRREADAAWREGLDTRRAELRRAEQRLQDRMVEAEARVAELGHRAAIARPVEEDPMLWAARGLEGFDTFPVPSHPPREKPVASHRLFCGFYRLSTGREHVRGSLPAQVTVVAWSVTVVPPQFGGIRVMRISSVAPSHIPDIVRIEREEETDEEDPRWPGQRRKRLVVDVSSLISVGRDHVVQWREALGEEEEGAGPGGSQLRKVEEGDWVRALSGVRFGQEQEEEWEARAAERQAHARGRREGREEERVEPEDAQAGEEEARRHAATPASAAVTGGELAVVSHDQGGSAGANPRPEGDARVTSRAVAEVAAARSSQKGYIAFGLVEAGVDAPWYTLRPLVSNYNGRMPPTITASTAAAHHARMLVRRLAEEGQGGSTALVAQGAGAALAVLEPDMTEEAAAALDLERVIGAPGGHRRERLLAGPEQDGLDAADRAGRDADVGYAAMQANADGAGLVPGYRASALDDCTVQLGLPPLRRGHKAHRPHLMLARVRGGRGHNRNDGSHGWGALGIVRRGRVGRGGTAGVEVLVVDEWDAPYYYGVNRGWQTGEHFHVGFRTAVTEPSRGARRSLPADTYVPHEEVATPNLPTPITGTVTHADRTYPFCTPSTPSNRASDMMHVLLTAFPSPPTPCCFTVLGHQEGGDYMVKSNPESEIGGLTMHVYRSFAYAQTGEVEEFRTNAGVPYWYNRRTGQTFWEPPLPGRPREVEDEAAERRQLQRLVGRGQRRVEREERTRAPLPVRLPDDLYATDDAGEFVHGRLLTPRGSLREDAIDLLREEQAQLQDERRAAIEDRAQAHRTAVAQARAAAAGEAVSGGAVGLEDGQLHGEGAGEGASLPLDAEGRLVELPGRGAALAVAGGRPLPGGGHGTDPTGLGGDGFRMGKEDGMGGTHPVGDLEEAGAYTEARMRQYMLAERDGEAFMQGRAASVRPRVDPETNQVDLLDAQEEAAKARAVAARSKGRRAGAAVVAGGGRFAVQGGPERPRGAPGEDESEGEASGDEDEDEADPSREPGRRAAALRERERARQDGASEGAVALAAAAAATAHEPVAAPWQPAVPHPRRLHDVHRGEAGARGTGGMGLPPGVGGPVEHDHIDLPHGGVEPLPPPEASGPDEEDESQSHMDVSSQLQGSATLGGMPGMMPGMMMPGMMSPMSPAGMPPHLMGAFPGMQPQMLQQQQQQQQQPQQQNLEALTASVTAALVAAMPALQQQGGGAMGSQDLLKLGLGLGLGLGMQQQQQQQQLQQQQQQQTAMTLGGQPSVFGGASVASSQLLPPALPVPTGGDQQSQLQGQQPAPFDGVSVLQPQPQQQQQQQQQQQGQTPRFRAGAGSFPTGEQQLVPQDAAASGRPSQQQPQQGSLAAPSATPDERLGRPNAQLVVPAEGRTGMDVVAAPPTLLQPPGDEQGHTDSMAVAADFVRGVGNPRTAPQRVSYLPMDRNLNKPRALGVVMPRRIIEDWSAVGYDPWSAGKRLRTTTIVRDIGTIFGDDAPAGGGGGGADDEEKDDGIPAALKDQTASKTRELLMATGAAAGIAAGAAKPDTNQRDAMIAKLFSLLRNGRNDQLEALLAEQTPSGGRGLAADIPPDARDTKGNTMLIVAAQNGNKRACRIALRRGADINARNTAGNTPLHFALAYGFEELGQWLVKKGADETAQNEDGLTPYEGLSQEDLDKL